MPHSIKIIGIAPPDLSSQPLPVRRQFWSLVAPIALAVKDKELAAGLDAHGDPLKPISPQTRKHRRSAMTPSGKGSPEAPPLMPAYQKSRTRSLLAARVLPTHVELYWRFDPFTGDQWSEILTYQKKMGRDVFGISPAGMKLIRSQAWSAWQKWKKSGLAPTEGPIPALPSAALAAGPQSRIAQIIAGSALPNAGARGVPQVGSMSTKFITRGIQAPTVQELRKGGRTGGLTGADWRRYYTAETGGGGGGVVVAPPAPRPIVPRPPAPPRPTIAAMKPAPTPKPAPPPVQASPAIGTPVSKALDVQAKGKTGQAILGAIRAIDSVHGDGSLPQIPVKQTAGTRALGTFWRKLDGTPMKIDVSSKGEHPRMTAVHEIGHFLDYGAIPRTLQGVGGPGAPGFRDFRKEAQFDEWVKAIEDSEAVKRLRDVMRKPYVVIEKTAAGEKRYKIDARHAKYLATDVELWARSYAQYIAHKSQQKELLDELSVHRKTMYSGVYGDQWADDDFRPIAAAFDNLFRKLGWLK